MKIWYPVLSLAFALQACAGVPAPYSSKEDFKDIKFTEQHQGQPLDMSGYQPTFVDEFDKMSVTDESGSGPWFSPVHSDFGASRFLPPSAPNSPVFVRNGKLIIQLRQEKDGWVSSNIQTVNAAGKGFTQQYGYFEMRAKLPPQVGSWSAFWLHATPARTGPGKPQAEVDIMEIYGGDHKGHHSSIHLWPGSPKTEGELNERWGTSNYQGYKDLFDGFHTYGAEIKPDVMIFYYDRKEVSRIATTPQFRTPLYMLVDLALLPKEKDLANGKGPMELEVDYVKAWQK